MKRDRPRVLRTTFGAGVPVDAVGLPPRPLADVYHLLLTWSWTRLFATMGVAYVATIALFAVAYLMLGDGAIEHARLDSFEDAFFFSFQTMATIGYGHMVPKSTTANVLSLAQVMLAIAGTAVSTGLVFAKFARPTARVLFSEHPVITRFDGAPALLFRMANARANQIVEAQVRCAVIRDEVTPEGHRIRRIVDLPLRRDRTIVFALTWTVVHPIDAASPFHGLDQAALSAAGLTLVASVSGLDEHLGQTVHARQAWTGDAIRVGHRLVDVLSERPDGTGLVDYRKFHEITPDPAPPVTAPAGDSRGS